MKLKLSLALLAFYLFSLVFTAPASLVTRFIPANAGVKIGHVSGTVWSGKLSQVNYQNKPALQRLTWRFDWLALLKLRLQADVKFDNGRRILEGSGAVGYGLSGLVLSDIDIDMQASQITPYLTLPVPVNPVGKLNLVIEHGSQGNPYCDELDGYLIWKDALLETPMANIDLDTSRINLSCDQGAVVASLKQDSAQLTTNAKVVLSKGERYKLEGDIMGHQQLDPTIRQALSWIGPQNSEGATVIKLDGRL